MTGTVAPAEFVEAEFAAIAARIGPDVTAKLEPFSEPVPEQDPEQDTEPAPDAAPDEKEKEAPQKETE
ncbi:hypothetical protein [Streptomonospora salina]|uniref:Uncharacterized protein n=1 Tax=Streptomonospora salina TaxID=104205 RepID=A0A841E7P9_9ACTN|nr:hypothetical protein [Streptomonospora salina]MBB5998902.1 hypothetical protein [Streptomonospora salina]